MLKNKFTPDKNMKRLDWDEMFMNIAIASSQRTACIYHKVGSVFVDNNHRIIAIGYNGPSVDDYHCLEVGCAKIHGDPLTGKIKHCRGVHSEMNALANCYDRKRLQGSTLYVTVFPCYDCMKVLNNIGVSKIVYLEEYKRVVPGKNERVTEVEEEAWELAHRRGIAIEQFDPEKRIIKDFTEVTNGSLMINKISDKSKKTEVKTPKNKSSRTKNRF